MEKIVYVGMSADIVHPGHINILKEASKLGKVTVGLLNDKAISSYKKIPFMSFEQRRAVIEGIKYVSETVEQKTLDYTDNLKQIKPHYVVHGDDWKNGIQKPIRQKVLDLLGEWNGELIEIPYTEGISSTGIKKNIKENITTEQRRGMLLRLLNSKNTLRFLDIHNALSGIVIENAFFEEGGETLEFDGMWGSSLTDSTAKGKPDTEAVDTTSRLITLNEILEVTTKPIIYDGDTGGKPEHLVFTVKNLERIGVSAIVIEDKKGLKKNSLFGNDVFQEQEDIEVFSKKISHAVSAKKTEEFFVIARIESLILDKGIDDALIRAESYLKAGSDGILIHSKSKSEKEIFKFIEKYKTVSNKPLVVVPTTYNHISFNEFESIGANIVIYANHLLRSSYPAMSETAKKILKHGRTSEFENDLMTVKDIINFIE